MRHQELLELMDEYRHWDDWKFYSALRAVVELHKPFIYTNYKGQELPFCSICIDPNSYNYDRIDYPCPTIQAITEQLK